jgi:hypothetical protein
MPGTLMAMLVNVPSRSLVEPGGVDALRGPRITTPQ